MITQTFFQYSSHKSRHIVRSVLRGGVIECADGMDYGLAMQEYTERMTGSKLKMKTYTDSKLLFDVITRNTITAEKRLTVHNRAIRQAYTHMDLDAVVWIRSDNNPGDALTKPMHNSMFNSIIETGKAKHTVEQWVIRSALRGEVM